MQTFSGFWSNFCEKRQIWVSKPHSGEVRRDARPWLIARWKAHGDFLFALIELFSLSIILIHEAKCVQFGYFRTGRPICTQILPGRGRSSSTIFWPQKTRDRHYATDGENRTHLRSLVLTQYRSVLDRRTDRRRIYSRLQN